MSGLALLRSTILRRSILNLSRRQLISTSKNNKSETVSVSDACKADTIQQKSNKYWVSYGFDNKNKQTDRWVMHASLFVMITMIMVWGGFYIAYSPDYSLRDWASREAFMELRRRESKGLPPIDANLIDPAKIKLPSDDELGDTEIVI